VGFFFLHHKSINVFQFRRIIIACIIFSFISFIISFYKRRSARCPLCIGTPLINTGALTHKRSKAIGPFNDGFTAVLSIAFTQKFRCMYCGTRYDLLKTPHRKLKHEEQ
jgi:DNA-directed RNA polymerase subunit RPC12/RpoP